MSARPMSLALLFALAVVLGSSAPARAGEDEKAPKKTTVEVKSAWAGHGVGSMVHRKHTQDTPMGKTTTEDKRTLVKISATHYELNVESKTMLGWSKSIEKEPKVVKVEVAADQNEEVGEETLTIQGKPYPCKKRKSKDVSGLIPGGMKAPGGRPGAPATGITGGGTVWLHDKLGMLKSVMTTSMMGQEVTIAMTVTKLDVARKVGDVTIKCRELTMTNSMMPGGKIVRLTSPEVPGETVYSEVSMEQGGMKIRMVGELVAWVKKPLAPVTTK